MAEEQQNPPPVAEPTETQNTVPATEGLPVEEPKPEEPKKEIIPEDVLESMKMLWNVFTRRSASLNPEKDKDILEKVVDIKHLHTIMRSLDFDLDKAELAIVTKQIDPSESGVIKWENMRLVMEDRLKEVDTYEDLIEQFKKLDKDSDGKIPAPEYKQYMKNMGVKMTEDQINEMMEEADAKGEGIVDMETFG